MRDFTQLCKDLEHYETPEWAAKAILRHEILVGDVVDPCTGTGILFEAALDAGYEGFAFDIHDWGYKYLEGVVDFLSIERMADGDFTIFMNPPFSKAVEFVEKAIDLGARKIVCFQRLAWWESEDRRTFWERNPPNRVYICGNRAICWRHDLPKDEAGNRFDPETGKKLAGAATAHAWFVWEKGQPAGTQLSHIWRDS